ncbi:exosome complex component RRP43-like [Gossypium australe]|uniref:Ribosomal RNA-processing protein 43 n=1 Tax=Gossypium australe TaxID=47621 RepID=A0A5B6VGD4_9ROSI|nr:exosome complex component RRP43-like [Gossypium australe]
MGLPNASGDLSTEVEVDAFRRLFPLRFYEKHLLESIRPDARPLGRARETTIALGAVASANGSALAKIGSTTMLAAIKMEVMTPSLETPDEGCIAIDFHMPPICSPIVRPGRPAEAAPVVAKQLSDTILRHANLNAKSAVCYLIFVWIQSLSSSSPLYLLMIIDVVNWVLKQLVMCNFSSGMINLKELSLVSGKAAWMAYLDIYCLDADGALFDTALLSAVAAFSHLEIPVVSLNDDGKIVLSEEQGLSDREPVNKEKRKINLSSVPFSLTCVLHKKYILADPTAEEESIMDTIVTVVLDSSSQLVSLHKPGGTVLAYTSAIQDCIALTRQRVKELQKILEEAISGMEVD